MFLLLVLALFLVVLSVVFFVATAFLQSYIFTEPTPGLAWRAPAAGAVLALFFTFWAYLVTTTDGRPGNNPYDTTFRYSPRVDLIPEAAPKLWAKYADGKTIVYVRKKDDDLRDRYQAERKSPTEPKRRWSPNGVVSLEMDVEPGGKMKFEKVAATEGDYRTFVSPEGWIMQEFEDGPTGIPQRYRWGSFLFNSLLNVFHGVVWFVCLWLILRYQGNHALGFAAILWLVTTLVVLPMLLDQASAVARVRPVATAHGGKLVNVPSQPGQAVTLLPPWEAHA